MAIELITEAYKRKLDGPGQRVLIVLCDMANEAGYSWPSVGYMAWRLGCDVTTVQRSLSNLEEKGAVRVLRRPGRASLYQVRLEALPMKEPYRPSREEAKALEAGPTEELYDFVLGPNNPPQNAGTIEPENHPPQNAGPPPAKCGTTPRNLPPRTVKEPSREPSEAPEAPKKGSKRTKLTMLPEDFTPDPKAWVRLREELRIPDSFIRDETEKFKAYFLGSGGTKLNWHQAWNFWIRKEVTSRRGSNRGPELAIVRSPSATKPVTLRRDEEEGEGNPLADLLRQKGTK